MSQDHVNSWYAASAKPLPPLPALHGDQSADVVVIGGGYTGLSSAIHLRKAGFSVVLLEANRIGWGASGRNGGHVGTGQRADQESLEAMVGREQAQTLWSLGLEAVDLVCELVNEFNIDCELKSGNLHVAASAKAAREIHEHVDHLQTHYGCEDFRYVDAEELSEMTSAQGMHGGMLDPRARHLHPLKYCLGLASAAQSLGVQMFENTRVSGYSEGDKLRVSCPNGEILCDRLVLACNGYLQNLESRVAGQIMPINNYMLATEPLDESLAQQLIRDDTSMSDSRFVVNYWKISEDQRLLFGGGESYTRRFPRDIAAFVRPYMLKIYPELESTSIEYAWGGTLAVTLNRMPAFGKVTTNIYYAHGYSGHGVPIATLAGKLIAEAMTENPDRFNVMANVPSPRFPGGTLLRWPGLVAGMLYYSMMDRFG